MQRQREGNINEAEASGIMNKCRTKNLFMRFENDETSSKYKSRSGETSVGKDEALLQAVAQKPSISDCTLSAAIGLSQTTIN